MASRSHGLDDFLTGVVNYLVANFSGAELPFKLGHSEALSRSRQANPGYRPRPRRRFR